VEKKGEAEKIARRLVEKELAACVNVNPGVNSFFRWQGRVENCREHMLVIKTKKSFFPRLVKEIRSCHSYSVPEIIALPIVAGEKKYLAWINESVGNAV
jgi:periplasmic divalent cation tolerance protein